MKKRRVLNGFPGRNYLLQEIKSANIYDHLPSWIYDKRFHR